MKEASRLWVQRCIFRKELDEEEREHWHKVSGRVAKAQTVLLVLVLLLWLLTSSLGAGAGR